MPGAENWTTLLPELALVGGALVLLLLMDAAVPRQRGVHLAVDHVRVDPRRPPELRDCSSGARSRRSASAGWSSRTASACSRGW